MNPLKVQATSPSRRGSLSPTRPRRNTRRVAAPKAILGYFLSDGTVCVIPYARIQPAYQNKIAENSIVKVDVRDGVKELEGEEVLVLKYSSVEYRLIRLLRYCTPPKSLPIEDVNSCFSRDEADADDESIIDIMCGPASDHELPQSDKESPGKVTKKSRKNSAETESGKTLSRPRTRTRGKAGTPVTPARRRGKAGTPARPKSATRRVSDKLVRKAKTKKTEDGEKKWRDLKKKEKFSWRDKPLGEGTKDKVVSRFMRNKFRPELNSMVHHAPNAMDHTLPMGIKAQNDETYTATELVDNVTGPILSKASSSEIVSSKAFYSGLHNHYNCVRDTIDKRRKELNADLDKRLNDPTAGIDDPEFAGILAEKLVEDGHDLAHLNSIPVNLHGQLTRKEAAEYKLQKEQESAKQADQAAKSKTDVDVVDSNGPHAKIDCQLSACGDYISQAEVDGQDRLDCALGSDGSTKDNALHICRVLNEAQRNPCNQSPDISEVPIKEKPGDFEDTLPYKAEAVNDRSVLRSLESSYLSDSDSLHLKLDTTVEELENEKKTEEQGHKSVNYSVQSVSVGSSGTSLPEVSHFFKRDGSNDGSRSDAGQPVVQESNKEFVHVTQVSLERMTQEELLGYIKQLENKVNMYSKEVCFFREQYDRNNIAPPPAPPKKHITKRMQQRVRVRYGDVHLQDIAHPTPDDPGFYHCERRQKMGDLNVDTSEHSLPDLPESDKGAHFLGPTESTPTDSKSIVLATSPDASPVASLITADVCLTSDNNTSESVVTQANEQPAKSAGVVTPAKEPPVVTPAKEPPVVTPAKEPLVVTHAEEPPVVTHAEEPPVVTPAEEPLVVTHAVEPLVVTLTEAQELIIADVHSEVLEAKSGDQELATEESICMNLAPTPVTQGQLSVELPTVKTPASHSYQSLCVGTPTVCTALLPKQLKYSSPLAVPIDTTPWHAKSTEQWTDTSRSPWPLHPKELNEMKNLKTGTLSFEKATTPTKKHASLSDVEELSNSGNSVADDEDKENGDEPSQKPVPSTEPSKKPVPSTDNVEECIRYLFEFVNELKQDGPIVNRSKILSWGITQGDLDDAIRKSTKQNKLACNLMRLLFTKEDRLKDVNIAGRQRRPPLAPGGDSDPKIQFIYQTVMKQFPEDTKTRPPSLRMKEMREAMDIANRNERRREKKKNTKKGRAVKGGQERGDKEPTRVEGKKSEEKSPRDSLAGSQKKSDGDHHGKAKGRKSGKSRPPTRERTSDLLRKQESEKYERNYHTWQQIKVDAREEGKERNLERIKLQQELIKAQDELYQENQAKREEERLTKWEAQKASKRAKAEELQKIGKDSFGGGDGRKARNSSAPRRRRTGTKTSVASESMASTKDDVFVTEAPAPKQAEREITQGDSESLVSSTTHTHPFGLPSTPASALEEEDEPEESTESETRPESEVVPWHHEQLYRLYGKKADYFLYPKFEPEKKKMVGPMNPKLRREGGRAGADILWNILRDESKVRLLRQDRQIPEELKFAYGAFVRQSLQHKRKPVKRNYCAQDDVPEMERLLDLSQVQNAQDYRHKVEIMFRSSHINEDRSKVLMFNNPIPNVNNIGGEESCGRYMPSWMDENWDEESEVSYKRWLKAHSRDMDNASQEQALSPEPEVADIPKEHVQPEDSTSNQWDFLTMKKRQNQTEKLPKIQFLTEKNATCKGQFSRRRKELLKNKDIPKAFEGETVKKSHSAMAMLGGEDGENQTSERKDSSTRSVARSQSEVHLSLWQPLSLQALAEYKPQQEAMGEGDYSQGRPGIWKTSVQAEQTV